MWRHHIVYRLCPPIRRQDWFSIHVFTMTHLLIISTHHIQALTVQCLQSNSKGFLIYLEVASRMPIPLAPSWVLLVGAVRPHQPNALKWWVFFETFLHCTEQRCLHLQQDRNGLYIKCRDKIKGLNHFIGKIVNKVHYIITQPSI